MVELRLMTTNIRGPVGLALGSDLHGEVSLLDVSLYTEHDLRCNYRQHRVESGPLFSKLLEAAQAERLWAWH
jgi:hypothetical protein